MTDRNVQWPNRYQLTKVPGTDNIYDLTPAPGTITAEGTMINKTTLLSDETAQAYGFTTEQLASVVPDDVLAAIKPLIDTAQSTADGRLKATFVDYTGTGANGVNAYNSISIPSWTKFVVVVGCRTNSANNTNAQGFMIIGKPRVLSTIGGRFGVRAARDTGVVYGWWESTRVRWYASGNNADDNQLNLSGVLYRAYCIGWED